jgi:serine/threonine protein kinase
MIGTIVHEQYQIQQLLGEGGMGVVYKALDMELDRLVALKFLKAELGDNQALIKRFRDELKVLAAFNHPNIALLYTSFNWQNRPVMVMEMVEGEPLNHLVGRCGPIPAHRCVPIALQALAGVGEAHRRGIVHRDLKPANLMLNQLNVVKVMDFGIAKIESSPGLTRTTATMGTPFYMAPEQIDPERFGLARVDARADIYAMGITLYELLAGQVPFMGATEFSIHRAHLEQVPQPPTIHYPHIPAPVVEAVLRAMAKDPKDRFQSAEQFADALRQTPLADPASQPQISLPQPGLIQPPAPSFTPVAQVALTASETSRTPVGAGHLNGQVTGAAATGPQHSTDLTIRTKPTQTRRNGLLIAVAAGLALLLVAGGGFSLYEFLKPSPGRSQSAHLSGGGGSGDSSPSSVAPHPNGGGEFKLPEPSPDSATPRKSEDIQLPLPNAAPRKPTLVLDQKRVPVAAPIPASVVAGQWSGYYMSCLDDSKTTVAMRLSESAADGTNSLGVYGRLTILNGTGGAQSCMLNNGAFVKSRNRLTFSVSSCSSGAAPNYLSGSHTTVLSLNGNQLDGVVAPDSPCMIVSFKKM